MKDTDIINLLLQKLNEYDIGFTTKLDPTFEEAPHYYELDEYGDLTDKSINEICKQIRSYIGDGAVDIKDAIELWITEASSNYQIAYKDLLVTTFEPKPVVDQIQAYENSVQLTENRAVRLQEENNKSAQLISAQFTDKNFDSESNEGQIVIRTSELFNALSDKGYDVQVTFDNGESQSAIKLGTTGGQVIITITNTNEPLKAYASGNFEITDDMLENLKDIKEEINAL